MKISPKIYAVSLYQALEGAPVGQQKKFINNFLRQLLRRGDFKLINKIVAAIEDHLDEVTKTVKLQVVSAKPLTEKLKKEIKDIFKKKLAAREVGLSEKVQPDVLGGLALSWNDQIIDVTLKKRLEQLKKHLVSA